MPSPITPQLVYDLVNVADPSISPDGTKVAYTRSEIERETSESNSTIVLQDLKSGVSSQFTGGPKDSLPMFSPDGDTLSFVRVDEDGNRQLWLIQTSGGEARRLTSVKGVLGVMGGGLRFGRRRLSGTGGTANMQVMGRRKPC